MRAHTEASPDDIDLTSLGAAARRALPKMLIAMLLVGAATYGVLSQLTPKFASQTQIEVIFNNPLDLRRGSNNESIALRLDKEAVGTHVRALMSSDLALKLAAEMKLADHAEFNSALAQRGFFGRVGQMLGLVGPRPSETVEDRVLAAYYDALRVHQVKDTRGITIEFRSEDPKLAADIANKLAELYRDDLSQRTVVETRDARAKLGPQIKTLADEAAQAEAEVTRFRGQANIFDGGRERSGLNEQQLTELTAEYTKASTARAETEARAQAAREQMLRGSGESQPDVQKSQLVPRLVEQRGRVERQLAELSATLLPAHPRMKQLNAELASVNRQIHTEVEKVVDSLDREVNVAAMREANIKDRIDAAKKSVVAAGGDDVKLRALEGIAKAKRTELERLQAQLEAARTTSDAAAVPGEVQVISRARPASEKVWPKTSMITLLAMTATLLLGMALAVTRELFVSARRPAAPPAGPNVHTPLALSKPVAVAKPVPAVAKSAPASGAEVVGSIGQLANQLVAKKKGKSGLRTLVAGADPHVDIGETAIDLARQLGQLGRQAILLDWSPNGVGLAHELGISRGPGAMDLLAGRATFEDIIGRLPESSAHVIRAGSGVGGSAAARDADRVNMLLDALDETYEHIIIAGGRNAARELFGTIEGRVDAGVLVVGVGGAKRDDFLGYRVADLDVIHYQPALQPRAEVREPDAEAPAI